MLIALWIINAILALLFLAVGLMKVARPKEALAASGMAWTANASAATVKLVGGIEIVGAVGLIVPLATGIMPILTPLAAVGLALVMIGACVLHSRRKESVATTLILAAISAASAVIGFISL